MGRPFVVLATTTTTTNTTIHYTAHPRFQGSIYFGEQAGMIRESATLNVHRPTMSSESWAKLRWQYVIMQQHQELSRDSGR
ncbi:unnamed protein product [Sphagnum troendelagicum]|uniref:NADH-plastoquinone oxidoreductase subunit K n=1 Tax=Sphagnum troendelagicum TaxID=128251 RepID=A0ABP0UFR1_9BRYO